MKKLYFNFSRIENNQIDWPYHLNNGDQIVNLVFRHSTKTQ